MRLYCDKLLEEVDEAQAAALRQAENDVSYREGSLRAMREEVSVCEGVVACFTDCFRLSPARLGPPIVASV